MTTEITSQLPPCPLPDCMGVEHHWHDIAVYAVTETHDCAKTARRGYRCYGPSVPQWQPIELAQIKAGMRIRATIQCEDRTTIYVGVAHHRPVGTRVWRTKEQWPLGGWGDSVTYEADPYTITDPDAALIEKIGKAIHDADESAYTWGGDEWGEDPSAETYRKLARAALDAVRAHDEAVSGDE